MSHLVKDPAVSPQWPRSLLWLRFSPWPSNFHVPWVRPKKKREEAKKERKDDLCKAFSIVSGT